MGYRLKNRNRPLPGGLCWRDPYVGFQASPFTSFDQQVQGIIQARLGNPAMAKRYRVSTDATVVANELDSALGKIAFENGWEDFYVGSPDDRVGASPIPPHPQKKSSPNLAGLVAGAKTLAEMFGNEGPVQKELAEKRALICVKCPVHEKADGDWIFKLFTGPAANAVKSMLSVIKGAKLETSVDSQLEVCGACGCPAKTKVHAQLHHILKHMPEDAKAALDQHCWINTLDGSNEPPPNL
jgi:hypothetical protein